MGAYLVAFNERDEPSWIGLINPSNTERIGAYKRFEHVDLHGAHVRDSTIRDLAKLEHIGTLHLTHCDVSDRQLGFLVDVGSIASLRLNGSPVSDAAIPAILTLPGLRSIDISGTLITPNGMAQLQQRSTDLVVRHGSR